MRFKSETLILAFLMLSGAAFADTFTFSGFLNDPFKTALHGSDLGPALFGDDFDIANNVAIYTFSVASPGSVSFVSSGFGLGGVDPYFSLFSGVGNSATFLASNYAQAFSTGGDFSIPLVLGAGSYTIALGAFANMSLAENYGVGTLGDGFIGLGEPDSLGNYYYQLDVRTAVTAVPEPASVVLLASGLSGLAAWKRRFETMH